MHKDKKPVLRLVHPYAWLWEGLESDASFVLRAMFGTKALYLDGKLLLCFSAQKEPWRGLLVCTDRAFHSSLCAEFPTLAPHPILPKWLYLPEADDRFEAVAQELVNVAKRRDPRIGVDPQKKRAKPPMGPAAAQRPTGPARRSKHR